MNKSELIDAIASAANLSKADAARALNATTDAISSAMSKGDGVQLTGFGSFVVNTKSLYRQEMKTITHTHPNS
jgi:DNA-binding protein HU-beta